MKVTKDKIRKMLNDIDGLYGCWVESSRKRRGEAKYDLRVRIGGGEIALGAADEVSRVLNAESVTIETGYEISGCCELCAGPEVYLELDIAGASLTL